MFWQTRFNSYAMSRCGLRKLCFRLKSAIFMRYYAVNRTYFSDQLAYGKMTLLNFSLLFPLVRSESTAYIWFFANLFHFPKLSSVHNFHSLLRHLLRFEFAVLLFDCERYKLAAQSIPQPFSCLGAIVFFAAFFLKRKRVLLPGESVTTLRICFERQRC